MSAGRPWSEMSPAEQLARCDERIAEHEAEGRLKSSASWKAHKSAILSTYADRNGAVQLPGDDDTTPGVVDVTQATDEGGSGGDSTRPRRRPNGATAGSARRRVRTSRRSRIAAAEADGDYALAARLKAEGMTEGLRPRRT